MHSAVDFRLGFSASYLVAIDNSNSMTSPLATTLARLVENMPTHLVNLSDMIVVVSFQTFEPLLDIAFVSTTFSLFNVPFK